MGYIMLSEFVVRRLPDKNRPQVRPWLWVGPALFLVAAFLLFPMIGTIVQSFEDNKGSFVGLQNFGDQLGSYPGGSWIAIRNNLIFWLIFYTLFVLAFGLLLAVLFDRVPYESTVKSLIFMPMAISLVALGVIWNFMDWYHPVGEWQSAALKGSPGELLEAARVDGAGEITIFRRVIFPLMMPTIVVVGTTLVIFALKAFDVVYVMTNGLYNSDVLALRMYNLLYLSRNNASASAVAVILLIAVIPVLIFNLRQFRAVEARR